MIISPAMPSFKPSEHGEMSSKCYIAGLQSLFRHSNTPQTLLP